VFLIMAAWLMVFTWQHLVPDDWRQGVRGIDLPDARAGAGVPDLAQGALVHTVD
jgi:hypothetical protein